DSGMADVVLTTGGTGLGPRDVTPEAARAIAHRDVPGLGEVMRAEGRAKTKFATLSRGGAVTRGSTLILNLPGSPKGALESLMAGGGLVSHTVGFFFGGTEQKKKKRNKKGERKNLNKI